MQFCIPHWESLRAAIDARGLSTLVSQSGEEADTKAMYAHQDGTNIDNFDPLMQAHDAIAGNSVQYAYDFIGDAAIMLLQKDTSEELQCPICFLNHLIKLHDAQCVDSRCEAPRGATYDWMIERAADDALMTWEDLKL